MWSVYDVYGVKTKIIESKLETINWMRMINPIIEEYVLIIKNYLWNASLKSLTSR